VLSQPVVVILFGGSGHRWTARVDTTTGGKWLAVSPTLGDDDATISVSATVGSLPRGAYAGRVTVTAPEAENTPQTIRVSLTVRDPVPASIRANPVALALAAVAGSGDGVTERITIAKDGDLPLNWRLTVSTAAGGGWLVASPSTGLDRGTITVAASAGALGQGSYSGALDITAEGATNSPVRVPVTLTVSRPAPVLQISTTTLNFAAEADGGAPGAQEIAIVNGGTGALSWRAAATTFNGGAWLAVGPASGAGAGRVRVVVDTTSLPAGEYLGRVTVSAEGAVNSPGHVQVALRVSREKPSFNARGVVNAASLQPGPVAPGAIVSVFGARLGPRNGVAATIDAATGKLPVELAGARVTFEGVAAPLLFVSAQQVNLQVPFEMAGRAAARMAVRVAGAEPAEETILLIDAAPAVFTLDGIRAAAVHPDGSLNSVQNPAPRGSLVQLFATGQGSVDPRTPTGAPAPLEAPFPAPRIQLRARLEGLEARLAFAGLAPGLVGVLQLNLEIPESLAPSDRVRLEVTAGGITSPPVWIAVR